MKITLAGMGELSRKDPLDAAAQDYAERLSHYCRFDLRVSEASVRKATPDETVRKLEAERLLKGVPPGAHRVALDERGTLHTTEKLAVRVQQWLNAGRDVVIFQGGATGLDAGLVASCAEKWSLSPLTLPHRMARVVALEALYRAFTVIRGEPYHRA